MSMSSDYRAPTYGNFRRPRSGGVLGLGQAGTIGLFAGLVTVVLGAMVGGLLVGVIMFAVVGGAGLLVVTRDTHHRSILGRIIGRAGFAAARSSGSNLYRSGPLGRSRWGTCQLPGLLASSELHEFRDGLGRPFALLVYRSTKHAVVVVQVDPDGSSLVDAWDVDNQVAHWGSWIAMIGNEPDLRAASVTVETIPDAGSRLAREIRARRVEGMPAIAAAHLDEAAATYPTGSFVGASYIALTFKMQGRSVDEVGQSLGERLPGLTADLEHTGAGPGYPVDADALCALVRSCYDPAVATLAADARAESGSTGLRWPDVGPAAHQADWESIRHDGSASVVWMMSRAPEGTIGSSVLARLIAPQADLQRKRITLLYQPYDAGKSAAIVEADARAADMNVRVSRRPSHRDRRDVSIAEKSAAEEAAGAGYVAFGVLITATVAMDPDADPKEQRQAVSKARTGIRNLAPAAKLRVRPCYGAQDSAFAAGLPLGLVLPDHTAMPVALREQL